MPRTKKDTQLQTKAKAIKSKKPAATKTSKAKESKTKPKAITTPKHSEVILNYCRFGNIGFSTIHETVDISFLSKKKFTGKITTLFHFIRQTEVCKNLDSGRIATFQINNKPVLSFTQKANDFENQVFTLTKYKEDGSMQSTRKYPYNKAKNLILLAFGFETKMDEDVDAEESEISSEDMKMQAESGNIEDDIDSEYGDME